MYFIKNMKNLNEVISSYLHLVLEPTLSTVISSSKSSALLFGETAVLDSFNAATSLCAKLGQPDLVMAIVESFGIPEHM